ncbi:MAG TPA: alpha/beta fold hydrolase, partial [Blastocatellia bacterium]
MPLNPMAYIEEMLTMRDGTRLYARRREANPSLAEIVIVHGFGEHSGRYSAITEHLVSHGMTVTAYDHRGHGQSDGLPGHVDRFSDYDRDLAAIVATVRARSTGPLFLVAHSMGGLIALHYLIEAGPEIAGAAISAPLLGFAVKVPGYKAMIGRISALVAPKFRMQNEIDPMVLCRDREICIAYAADP